MRHRNTRNTNWKDRLTRDKRRHTWNQINNQHEGKTRSQGAKTHTGPWSWQQHSLVFARFTGEPGDQRDILHKPLKSHNNECVKWMNVNLMNEKSANQTLLLPLRASLRNQSLTSVILPKIIHHKRSAICVYLKGNDLNIIGYDMIHEWISTARSPIKQLRYRLSKTKPALCQE